MHIVIDAALFRTSRPQQFEKLLPDGILHAWLGLDSRDHCDDLIGHFSSPSPREWIGAHLDLVNLRPRAGTPFVMKHGASAQRGPQSFSLPAGVGIVDAAIDILTKKAQRVGNADDHELPVHQRGHRFAAIRHRERHVRPESQRVVAIDPDIVGVLRTSGIGYALELRSRVFIQRPAFGTVLAGCCSRSVERALAFAPVEAGEMSARKCWPNDAIGIQIYAAGAVSYVRRKI